MQNFLKTLDPCLAEQLERYALEVGTPVELCVDEAITDYLHCTARTRLEYFRGARKLQIVKK